MLPPPIELLRFEGDDVVQDIFGTVGTSMWTLFMVMTLDSWGQLLDPVIRAAPLTRVLFVLPNLRNPLRMSTIEGGEKNVYQVFQNLAFRHVITFLLMYIHFGAVFVLCLDAFNNLGAGD